MVGIALLVVAVIVVIALSVVALGILGLVLSLLGGGLGLGVARVRHHDL